LNPVRETPVLELDDGTCIAQSNAILWYLAEGTRYLPGARVGRAQVAQWLAFEQERVMAGVGSARFRTLTGREAADPARVAAQRATGRNALELLDAHLASRAFVVGDSATIADLAIFAYGARAPEAGIAIDDLPHFVAWTGRIRALPGFMDDLEPYPANAAAGAGRSIYG
jgi:glutathione S-transferase